VSAPDSDGIACRFQKRPRGQIFSLLETLFGDSADVVGQKALRRLVVFLSNQTGDLLCDVAVSHDMDF
jgi:hypothetical protein